MQKNEYKKMIDEAVQGYSKIQTKDFSHYQQQNDHL
jgi:hypothetical protein